MRFAWQGPRFDVLIFQEFAGVLFGAPMRISEWLSEASEREEDTIPDFISNSKAH
ncbi:hypothetical protein [Rhizobium sp. R339]|uniref:hypothetical protein n=1 Tax=Rhizobium sp. R339 TaxID=1764273 RepID=UPI00167DF9A9|nr:hypothetical protein [Rhizobium sp. R339]